MQTVYFDNNATTRTADEVREAMLPFFGELYGNPSSMHAVGGGVAKHLAEARERVAAFLNCSPEEILFTSCATESDNTALRGVAEWYGTGTKIITTAVEHPAILQPARRLKAQGYTEVELPVNGVGQIDLDQLRAELQGTKNALVSTMWANNETGTVFPLREIAEIAKEYGATMHTDAVQAAGKVPIDVQKIPIDMLSLSGHKFHAPKGIGLLYVRKGTKFKPFMLGGHQENGRRAGTENVPGIVGLAKALEIQTENLEANMQKMIALRDKLIAGVEEKIPTVHLNGHRTQRLPNNVNFGIRYIESESILLMLDLKGVAASSGSACTSGSLDPSHVLLAMGISHEAANGSLRMTLSEFTTEEEIDYVLEVLPPIVQRLRDMSPIYPKGGVQ